MEKAIWSYENRAGGWWIAVSFVLFFLVFSLIFFLREKRGVL
jgi:hypothetical protein